MAGTEPIVQHSDAWLKAADPEAILVAKSQGRLDVLLGVRDLAPGEQFDDSMPDASVQRDEAWLDAHKNDLAEIMRAKNAGELDELLGLRAHG